MKNIYIQCIVESKQRTEMRENKALNQFSQVIKQYKSFMETNVVHILFFRIKGKKYFREL